jgi:hypothetical protein
MRAILSPAGMLPLSVRITTRGKAVSGKLDDDRLMAARTPVTHSATKMKRIDSDERAANHQSMSQQRAS